MSQHKIHFRLKQDDDGYPPVNVESMWATKTKDGFEIDNIPFYTREATLGDIVAAKKKDGVLFYASTLVESDNSLLRVIVFDGEDPADLRARLKKLGCESEGADDPSFIAVNVPASVKLAKVKRILDAGCEAEKWDYEEAILRQ